MPDLAPTIDGPIIKAGQSSWANARDATSGTASTTSRHVSAVNAIRSAGRGGSILYQVQRSFFEFDTSGISVTPTDATLKIYGFGGINADLFVVKANFSDGALANGDFDAIVGWSAGADNSSNVTKYRDHEVTIWSTSGYNDITLNAAALTSMTDDDVIKFCLIESTKDLPNVAMTSNATIKTGMYFQENTGTSKDPILNYTAAGYGNDIMGVASANIGKVNSLATANIEKVIGV